MSVTFSAPVASSAVPSACFRSTVYFFLDFSNIAITAGKIAPDHGDGLLDRRHVRLHCRNLRRFVERDRVWGKGYAAAGLKNQDSTIKRHFEQVDIRFDIFERGEVTGREQNVDERIQLEMYRLPAPRDEEATVVLATGDGKGTERGDGFISALTELRNRGFEVEVMSWAESFNQHLRNWAALNGRAIELDEFHQDLTFVEGRRPASPEHVLNRKLARRLAA